MRIFLLTAVPTAFLLSGCVVESYETTQYVHPVPVAPVTTTTTYYTNVRPSRHHHHHHKRSWVAPVAPDRSHTVVPSIAPRPVPVIHPDRSHTVVPSVPGDESVVVPDHSQTVVPSVEPSSSTIAPEVTSGTVTPDVPF